MRVVLVVPSFPKLSESFIVSKFLGLLEADVDMHVVCGSSDSMQWRNFPDLERHPEARKRVKVAWPHRPRWLAALLAPVAILWCLARNPRGMARYLWRGWRRYRTGIFRLFYLDASIIALGPDLVHFEFGTLALERMHLKEFLGCKTIVSFRGYDLNLCGLEDPNYFREIWSHADALHLLGEGLWRQAQRRGCPNSKRHVLIPPAINTSLFAPDNSVSEKSPEGQPLRILSVGRLTWEKGYEHALQAVRLLVDVGVSCELRIVGEGPMFEALAFACHQLDLKNQVHFLGALSGSRVREEMLSADIFLHAAVSEGFCNAVIEAQAMGLPVVSSDAGGLAENVADGISGFVVTRRDPRAMADKLITLARNAKQRKTMGMAGRERVMKFFKLEDQVKAFRQLYLATLEGQ